MQFIAAKLTVYFENPYWVGIYERRTADKLTVCRIVFGPEPKDYDVYGFLLENWHRLKFSSSVQEIAPSASRVNPKRMQREIRKQLTSGIGTKAQQAIQQQRAEGKAARKKKSRQQREEEKAHHFARKQEKRKQKHRGH